MLWMMTDMKKPLSENIRYALEHHERKYGRVPNLIEHGLGLQNLPPIDGVRYVPVSIPSNILLVGVE